VTSLYVTLGFVAVTLALLWVAISFAKSSARYRQALMEAIDDIEALKEYNERMSEDPLSGKDLVDSLRSRSNGG
jgi:uncharacterized membrane protein YbaN (DUF454 family)|tara:strand:- start:8005 stop:8226 length:222 start_codon:yes stop_codon:yes gene_type:complete